MLNPLNARIRLIICHSSAPEMGSYHVMLPAAETAGATRGDMRIALGLLLGVSILSGQGCNYIPDAHIAAAKAAAGEDFQNLFNFQCYGPGPGAQRPGAGTGTAQQGGGQGAGQAGGGQRQPGPP